MKLNKTKLIVLLLGILVVMVGASFAYYLPRISGKDKQSKTVVGTELHELTIALTKTPNNVINYPDESVIYEFAVTNTGDTELASYNIFFSNVVNNYNYPEHLKYTLTCTSVLTDTQAKRGKCDSKTNTQAPVTAKLMHTSSSIGVGITHKYTLQITYEEAGFDQTIDKAKEFSFDIHLNQMVQDPYLTSTNVLKMDIETSPSSTFLGSSFTRNKIESIEFTDHVFVPIGVIDSWDVSRNQNKSIMAWYTDNNNNGLYEVTIGQVDGVIANPDSKYLFANLTNMTTINGANFNTENVKNMSYMFSGCNNLTTVNLSTVTSKLGLITTFMFEGCINIDMLDIRSFDFNNISNSLNMLTDLPNDSKTKVYVKNEAASIIIKTSKPSITTIIE